MKCGAWQMDEIEITLRDIIKKEGIHPVDPVTIASKSSPIPLKDVKKNWLTSISEGYYCGHNSIRETLEKDTFDALIGDRIRKVSRWALNTVSPDLRNQANLAKAELKAQFDKNHGGATLKSDKTSITPSIALCKKDGSQRRIIAVRIFHGGAQQVVNDVAYYFHFAFMRCNLAQDVHLEEGVYAYVDIDSALKKLDRNNPTDRTKCIGIIEGYV